MSIIITMHFKSLSISRLKADFGPILYEVASNIKKQVQCLIDTMSYGGFHARYGSG